MTFRMIEMQPNDVIAVVNKTTLLKFIGWCEAHRPPADHEPGFVGRILTDLEHSGDGYALDATAECFICGEEHSLLSADEHLYRDGEWYCKDRDACNERAAVTCAGCGAKWHPSDSGVYHDPDSDGWFCWDRGSGKCKQRRMDGAA